MIPSIPTLRETPLQPLVIKPVDPIKQRIDSLGHSDLSYIDYERYDDPYINRNQPNLEGVYESNQSGFTKTRNALGQLGAIATTSFLETMTSNLTQFAGFAPSKDIQALSYDNWFTDLVHNSTEWASNTMPIYSKTEYGFKDKALNTFWQTLPQVGFTVGTGAGIAFTDYLLGLATVGSGGAAAPATVAAASVTTANGLSKIAKAWRGMKIGAKMFKDTLTPTNFKALYLNYTMSSAEAAVEAHGVMTGMYDKGIYDKELINDAARNDFLINKAILSVTNIPEMALFKAGTNNVGRALRYITRSNSSNSLISRASRQLLGGAGMNIGKGAVLSAVKAPIASKIFRRLVLQGASEGFEEFEQTVASNTILDMYNTESNDYVRLGSIFDKMYKDQGKHLSTREGQDSIASGFLIGMIMGGGSKGINMASNVLRTKEGAEATRVSKLADKLYNNTLSEDTATYLNYKKIAEKANKEGLPEVRQKIAGELTDKYNKLSKGFERLSETDKDLYDQLFDDKGNMKDFDFGKEVTKATTEYVNATDKTRSEAGRKLTTLRALFKDFSEFKELANSKLFSKKDDKVEIDQDVFENLLNRSLVANNTNYKATVYRNFEKINAAIHEMDYSQANHISDTMRLNLLTHLTESGLDETHSLKMKEFEQLDEKELKEIGIEGINFSESSNKLNEDLKKYKGIKDEIKASYISNHQDNGKIVLNNYETEKNDDNSVKKDSEGNVVYKLDAEGNKIPVKQTDEEKAAIINIYAEKAAHISARLQMGIQYSQEHIADLEDELTKKLGIDSAYIFTLFKDAYIPVSEERLAFFKTLLSEETFETVSSFKTGGRLVEELSITEQELSTLQEISDKEDEIKNRIKYLKEKKSKLLKLLNHFNNSSISKNNISKIVYDYLAFESKNSLLQSNNKSVFDYTKYGIGQKSFEEVQDDLDTLIDEYAKQGQYAKMVELLSTKDSFYKLVKFVNESITADEMHRSMAAIKVSEKPGESGAKPEPPTEKSEEELEAEKVTELDKDTVDALKTKVEEGLKGFTLNKDFESIEDLRKLSEEDFKKLGTSYFSIGGKYYEVRFATTKGFSKVSKSVNKEKTLSDIEVGVVNGGFNEVTPNAKDLRLSTTSLTDKDLKQQEFIKNNIVTYEVGKEGQTYLVAQVGYHGNNGRFGFIVTSVKKSKDLPSNVNDLLILKAIEKWNSTEDFKNHNEFKQAYNYAKSNIDKVEKQILKSTEKPTEKSKQESPISETATQSDIEAKKADIEKRRQEELKSIVQPSPIEVYDENGNLVQTTDKAVDINAKYDAELKALESKQNTLPTTEESKQESLPVVSENRVMVIEPIIRRSEYEGKSGGNNPTGFAIGNLNDIIAREIFAGRDADKDSIKQEFLANNIGNEELFEKQYDRLVETIKKLKVQTEKKFGKNVQFITDPKFLIYTDESTEAKIGGETDIIIITDKEAIIADFKALQGVTYVNLYKTQLTIYRKALSQILEKVKDVKVSEKGYLLITDKDGYKPNISEIDIDINFKASVDSLSNFSLSNIVINLEALKKDFEDDESKSYIDGLINKFFNQSLSPNIYETVDEDSVKFDGLNILGIPDELKTKLLELFNDDSLKSHIIKYKIAELDNTGILNIVDTTEKLNVAFDEDNIKGLLNNALSDDLVLKFKDNSILIKNDDKHIVIDLTNEIIYEVDSDKEFTENELIKTWYTLILNSKISLYSEVLADVPIELLTNEPYFSIRPSVIKEEFKNSNITEMNQLSTFHDKIKLHENIHVKISELLLNDSKIVTNSNSAENSQLELSQEDILNLICG
jgi:hypothetical protein